MEENKETVEEKITVEDMDELLLDFEKAICEFCDFWKGQDFCYHNITKRYVKVFKSVYHKISSENDALASLVVCYWYCRKNSLYNLWSLWWKMDVSIKMCKG